MGATERTLLEGVRGERGRAERANARHQGAREGDTARHNTPLAPFRPRNGQSVSAKVGCSVGTLPERERRVLGVPAAPTRLAAGPAAVQGSREPARPVIKQPRSLVARPRATRATSGSPCPEDRPEHEDRPHQDTGTQGYRGEEQATEFLEPGSTLLRRADEADEREASADPDLT